MGEQITLAFEAAVTNLPPGRPFDIGLSVAIGDTIRGTLTFTPDPGDGGKYLEVIQADASATFLIDGKAFASSAAGSPVSFKAINNTDVIDAGSGTQDQLALGTTFDVIPSGLPITATRSGWSIEMAALTEMVLGSPPVDLGRPLLAFESAMIPSDVGIWNYFTIPQEDGLGARIYVSFRNDDDGVVGFEARVSRFTQSPIPEPSSVALAISVVAFFCSTKR